MSLFSDYGSLGFPATTNFQLQRSLTLVCDPVSTDTYKPKIQTSALYDGGLYGAATTGFDNGTNRKCCVWFIDFNAGKIKLNTFTTINAGSKKGIVWNPITGGFIMQNPTNPSAGSTLAESTNGGASFTNIGVNDDFNTLSGNQEPFGYNTWWDGTNFVIKTNSGTYRTTNGTSWSTLSPGFTSYAAIAPNSYAAYSGYYFHQSGTSYSYRTSITGSDTGVSGYTITGISPNGRYVMRQESTGTYNIQYSSDGGASWSAVSSIWHMNGTTVMQFCTNNGDFCAMGTLGVVLRYNTSTGQWECFGGPSYAPQVYGYNRINNTDVLLTAFTGDNSYVANATGQTLTALGVCEMPKFQ